MAMWPLGKPKPFLGQDTPLGGLTIGEQIYDANVEAQKLQVEVERRIMAAAVNSPQVYGMSPAQQLTGQGNAADNPSGKEPTFDGLSGLRLICARLRMSSRDILKGGLEIASIRETLEHTVLFGMAHGQPIMLTDEKHLFPSDTLITKIRAILK